MSVRSELDRFRSQRRSLLPTPIEFLDRLSARLGTRVYVKRDDLTGFGLGGNKTRKLDYLVAEPAAQRADTLVGMGAVQSNFCRILAAAGAASGMEVHLVLGGQLPDSPHSERPARRPPESVIVSPVIRPRVRVERPIPRKKE